MNPKRLLSLFFALLLGLPVAAAGQANVFVYHRFGDAVYPTTNIELPVFAAQLQLLHDEGYRVLSLGEVVSHLRDGRLLPDRCAVLTVDDAYATFLTGAMPLLRRYGYPVTLFVSTNSVGHHGYLSWDELRALAAEGVEIGNHSASHPYLLNRRKSETTHEHLQRAQEEILRAQRRLERELGAVPLLFAYPFGEFDPELRELVRELGFLGAVGQQSGVVFSGSDRFVLPRFPMGGIYGTLEGFAEKMRVRALPVEVVAPASPVVSGEDPPVLRVRIDGEGIDLRYLRAFVQGQEEAVVTGPDGEGEYVVRARRPLAGRRNKYTLTAPGREDGRWYWFSQLWVYPERGVTGAVRR